MQRFTQDVFKNHELAVEKSKDEFIYEIGIINQYLDLLEAEAEAKKELKKLELALKRIESEAYRKSQSIKGEAEAEAILILAKPLKSNPDFYAFVKTLDIYKTTIAKKGNFILSTDSAFLRILNQGS